MLSQPPPERWGKVNFLVSWPLMGTVGSRSLQLCDKDSWGPFFRDTLVRAARYVCFGPVTRWGPIVQFPESRLSGVESLECGRSLVELDLELFLLSFSLSLCREREREGPLDCAAMQRTKTTRAAREERPYRCFLSLLVSIPCRQYF